MRVGGMGSVLGYDYNALALLAEAHGIDQTPALWKKIRTVEAVILKQQAEKNKAR